MSEDSGFYEGGQCQQQYTTPLTFEIPKPNYNVTFQNADGEQVGVLDFNGPGLTFEGNAEVSAILFIDWMAKTFVGRMKEEYDKGFADGKASQSTP